MLWYNQFIWKKILFSIILKAQVCVKHDFSATVNFLINLAIRYAGIIITKKQQQQNTFFEIDSDKYARCYVLVIWGNLTFNTIHLSQFKIMFAHLEPLINLFQLSTKLTNSFWKKEEKHHSWEADM